MTASSLKPASALAPPAEAVAPADEVETWLAPEDWPQVDDLITEDDTPVDNFFSEKQQRLLTEPLYTSWGGPGEGRVFLASANVGLFYALRQPPLVPDVFLSLDVKPAADWWAKRHRTYFLWEFGKPPEVVIEIVSNTEGEETGRKLREYARMGVAYYVVFDPAEHLRGGVLRMFELGWRRYEAMTENFLPDVGLGLVLWQGLYEGQEDLWLRWCDLDGNLILTGAERAQQAEMRLEQEHQRAEQEHQRAEQERQRAERLAAQLRALGVQPEEGG